MNSVKAICILCDDEQILNQHLDCRMPAKFGRNVARKWFILFSKHLAMLRRQSGPLGDFFGYFPNLRTWPSCYDCCGGWEIKIMCLFVTGKTGFFANLMEIWWCNPCSLGSQGNQASLTMLHKIHNKQVNVDHSHLTTTRNNKFLFPHSKQNTTWTHSFRGLYDFGTNFRLRLRMPQLYLHLQVD